MAAPLNRRRSRTSLWIAASLLVLAGVVGALYVVSSSGLGTLIMARSSMEVDADWNRWHQDAVIHLHHYALTGDPGAWEDYERAMEYPRAVHPALVAAIEYPGDSARVREAIASSPRISGGADFWAEMIGSYGGLPQFVDVNRLRLRKSELLRVLDDEARAMRATLEEEGPGSPAVQERLATTRQLHRQIESITDPFWDGMSDWADQQDDLVRRVLAASSLLLLVLGGAVVGFAGWRSKRAEDALVESEARFRQVAENIREVFWLREARDDRLLYVSPAYEEVWGRRREQLMRNPDTWLESLHPDDRPRIRELWDSDAHLHFDEEYRIVRDDGEVRWIHDRAFPVRDEEGEIHRVAGLAEDVTQRKDLEREVVQSQKLKAVGRLAGGIGHEFNNLLMVVQGHIQLLRAELSSHVDLDADLDEAEEATKKAARLTRRLLSFAGRQMLVTRTVDLPDFVRESEDMVESLLPDDVALRVSLEERVLVDTDPSYLRDTLLTLASRAVEAMPDGGTLTLAAGWTEEDAEVPVEGGRLPAGRWGRLVVEDTGRGVSPEVRERLFEPFGVTVDEGPRLGMASVYGVVEQSGGGIRVESPAGGGTRFVVYLPEGRRVTTLDDAPRTAEEGTLGVKAGA